jgi:DUF4097 and DUF4098 domain-containing protein YvlB
MKKIFAIIFMIIVSVSLSNAWKFTDDESDHQSKSFTVQKGGLLTVDVEPGAVRIESWSKDEVFVEAEGIDERHPDRLEMNQTGNNVTVKYRDRRSRNNHLRFIIKVPSKFNIDVQTSGGSINQKDELIGDFQAETRGGSIDIDHIIGKVDVETGGGSIKAEKIEGNASMQTGGGSISTGCVTGILDARTGGGSITAHESGGKVNASTGGGSIKVENAGAWVELSTGGGSVTVSGAKYGAKVKTGGGSVKMEDITGMVDVSTGGGSIQCELNPGSSGNSKIKTGGGEIQFYLPDNAKAIVKATINEGHGWGGWHDRDYSIRADFKADTQEKNEDGKIIYAEYTLNGGGPIILLETSNSDIEIRIMSAK